MLRRLLGIFLVSSLLSGLLGTGTAPSWSSAVGLAVAFGLYTTATFLSIVTWSAARGDSPQIWTTALGPDAPAIVSSFYDLARQHVGIVIGTTLLTAVGFGAGLWGWFQVQYFGLALSPNPLMILTAAAAICGTMAGPGFAVLGLYLLHGPTAEAKQQAEEVMTTSDDSSEVQPSDMRTALLRSTAFHLITTTLFTAGLLGQFQENPYLPDAQTAPIASFDFWGIFFRAIGLQFWDSTPIILPIVLTATGLFTAIPVLAEEYDWRHANTLLLLPWAFLHVDADRLPTEGPSLAWRCYNAIRGWAPYVSGLLGLGAGTAQFVWPLFPSLPLIATLGLSVLAAVLVSAGTIGWLTTLVVFTRDASGPRSFQTESR